MWERYASVDERDVWVLAAQVAAGLTHIHSYGILHLDIKPDNIFLDRHGTYKIGDFGGEGGSRLTQRVKPRKSVDSKVKTPS